MASSSAGMPQDTRDSSLMQTAVKLASLLPACEVCGVHVLVSLQCLVDDALACPTHSLRLQVPHGAHTGAQPCQPASARQGGQHPPRLQVRPALQHQTA